MSEEGVEERDDRKEQKRRGDGTEDGDSGARDAGDAVADQDRGVDGDGARARLCDSSQVQDFLFFDPMEFVDEFLFHQGDDDVAAAEGKSAQTKSGGKQRPILVLFHKIQCSFSGKVFLVISIIYVIPFVK